MVKLMFKLIVALILLFISSYCIVIAVMEESLFYIVFGWFSIWLYQKTIMEKNNE